MHWIKLGYRVDREDVDAFTEALEQAGARAVTLENAGEDAFYEVAFPGRPAWQKVSVTGLFAAEDPVSGVDTMVRQLVDLERIPPMVEEVLEDRDWTRAWMDNFRPIEVGRGLWVCPTGSDNPDPTAVVINLDPGLAFGTGSHPTTALCLDWLSREDLGGASVIDYGCGSGILGIAAALLGAEKVVCTDIDPLALDSARTNAARNGVPDIVECSKPALVDGQADLVIANILADVLVDLSPVLRPLVSPHGVILLTGILEGQSGRVMEAYAPHFEFSAVHRDEWCLLVGTSKVNTGPGPEQ